MKRFIIAVALFIAGLSAQGQSAFFVDVLKEGHEVDTIMGSQIILQWSSEDDCFHLTEMVDTTNEKIYILTDENWVEYGFAVNWKWLVCEYWNDEEYCNNLIIE